MALSKLQNGKATGHDQIPPELTKDGGKDLKKVIYEIVLNIREQVFITQAWKYGIMCTVHKGDLLMYDNYRAVTLLCTTYKIPANVKLVPFASEIIREYKGGFRREKSTVDQIFTMRQIPENC
jgi:hypothetical protein